MKNKVSKRILLTGILCAMSLSVCACGGKKEAPVSEVQQTDEEAPDPEVQQTDEEAPAPEEGDSAPEPSANAEKNDQVQEPEADADKAGTAAKDSQADQSKAQGAEAGESGNAAADGSQKEQASTEGLPGTWKDSTPDLAGAIKEMQDGQLTVIEAVTDKTDDGAVVMAEPAPGADDSDFNKVTVNYDEKTLFAIKTIYDGGARFEMKEATAADLEKGRSVNVWGEYSGGGLKASQICIIKVV